MFKFINGALRNNEGKESPIVVRSGFPMTLKPFIVGSVLLIAGIGCYAYGSFRKGVLCFEKAEFDTMKSLGILTEHGYTEHAQLYPKDFK